jgi:Tfp pilus assembly protein PilF
MKKTSMKFFGYLALATVVASCSSLDKMRTNAPDIEYTVTPEVLEAQGGKVEANIRVQIPGGYFDPKATLVATPVLVYEGGETAFPSYSVQGEKATGNNQVISKLNGGQVNYTNSVDYNKDMRVSDLEVRITATRGTATADFEPVKIAEGVISTAEMVTADGILGSIGADQFERIIPISKTAEILYLIQQANIRNSELTKDEVKKLNEFINEVKAAENKEFKGASISAYASPDGAVDLNTNLASKRETSAKKVLDKQLSKAKVDEAKEENFFDLKSTPEDWEGFKALMEKSDIQDKDLILRVLSMYTDPEVREREIKNMSQTFEVIAKEILPQLRRSKMSINVDEIGKSDEEISQLAGSNSADLTVEEILYAGTLTEDATEKEAIYKKAAAQYPNDWRTHNNVGYALYLQGNYSDAKVAFEKANSVKANQPEVMNNLGAVALQEGDIAKAEEYFGAAAGAGKELDNNLGVVELKKGQYEQAIRYFGNSTSCNAALARILNKDYAGATATLNANTMEVAQKYYLKAIVGARTNEANQIFSNLSKAVELDASYKAMAATDMEFAKYFEDATFKSTIQ